MIRNIYDNYKKMIGYTLIAVLVGIIIGIIDTIFGKVLLELSAVRENNAVKLVPFLPVAGVLLMILYRKFSRESLRGMTLVFETGFGNQDRIPKLLVPLVILSTWITHLFGGSAGREGVAVQLGATVAHTVGRKMKLPDNSRVLLITGMAAGFAGLFQTPFAATFFALEVLVAGTIQYEALLPALAASFSASYTSHFLGLEKFSVVIGDNLEISTPVVINLILLGIAFGVTGGIFAHALSFSKKLFEKIINDPIRRIFIMGIVLALLLLVFHTGRYCGLGTNLIHAGFTGGEIYFYDWILKIVLTILTLSAGFQGGEVTPLFAIGSSFGIVLAGILGFPAMLAAALGYAALFGSATNTLIAPILIGVEVFGTENLLFFVIVCSISYVFNGNKTIYGSQKKFNYFDPD